MFLLTALIAGGLSALLALNTASAAEELRSRSFSQQNADLAAAVQQLQREIADEQAPAALASAAAALGMVPVTNPAFLSVGTDGRVRVLGDPTPAAAAVVPAPSPKPTPTPTPSPTRTTHPASNPSPTTVRTIPGGPR